MHGIHLPISQPDVDFKSGSETSPLSKPSISCRVIRRNGKQTSFDHSKIVVALSKAFLAVESDKAATSRRVHEKVEQLTKQVCAALFRHLGENDIVHIENIQDQVELALMRNGEHKVARAYVLYREQRARQRAEKESTTDPTLTVIEIMLDNGERRPLDETHLHSMVAEAVDGIADVSAAQLMDVIRKSLFDGMSDKDLHDSMIMSTRQLIDGEPNYSRVATRLLMNKLRREALVSVFSDFNKIQLADMPKLYGDYFKAYIKRAVELELLDEELQRFDLDRIALELDAERDRQFHYLGLQTLYDRYFLHHDDKRLELPQAFFMRVAMGLSLNETNREARAIEFYRLLSSFNFMCSTPTLFNAGTRRSQLSSCFLTTVPDSLDGIYSAIKDNALLSKYAGGLGNDWSQVRGLGAHITGTNGKSQGIVPFLKVANDTAVAVNQGGKRKGATCAYLESWHIDVEEFLELRKNTGDDRRRTHDMNTANWIPDLFMKRVAENAQWTLFSPDEVKDLHELYGEAFERSYLEYEAKAMRGDINVFKVVNAVDLWRKMLGMLFETGHPWITFKDPCNIRYTNQHLGMVHSSNLCTEITLHTNENEIAVCNLGSINLATHMNADGLDYEKLKRTISTAMRMLDNVIDINYYTVPQAHRSNKQHRPVGLGIMGFQDVLHKQGIAYASEQAVVFADVSMEAVSYFAIEASSDLARERGVYPSYPGSLWSQGILPLDSIAMLKQQRNNYIDCDGSSTMDWNALRKKVSQQGMRNSNCLAIAPTATIANICNVSQSIEPTYQNLYVKSNLSGEFTLINPYLVASLKAAGLWDEVMVNDLKYYDGSLTNIDRIPREMKEQYATAFEIDSRWLIEAAARRQKWIDQGQSLNLYMAEPSGKKMDQLYKLAWVRGLKTTYYLRTIGATHMEKQTTTVNTKAVQTCSTDNPDCEACQ